ncbi:MAG: carbon-nitrogen hydrolase family protein [Acidobacteriaceae bacterium]|nr:carbon-nitrogen hydrolase family protein [Acidobacteriaceae bacterium]
MRLVLLFSLLLPAYGEVLFRQSAFEAAPPDWSAWSHRPESRPRTFVDTRVSRGGRGSLAVNGQSNVAAYGGWRKHVAGVQGGDWLRLRAFYKAESVAAENWQIVARLDWQNAAGKRSGEPAYVPWTQPQGEWSELQSEAQAPAGTASVYVELFLANAPQGTVWWDDISLERIPAPPARKVNVATVNFRPQTSSGREENVNLFLAAIAKSVPANADVILLPEGITVVGTGKSYQEVAEPIPGPTTRALSEVAKARKAYIAAGIYEQEGHVLYNTAILLDRQGELVGKYRKVYLPREEVEKGLTPGTHYPVFPTDFGKVGLMICYDVFFAEPARALTNQGADMILMPIWGGDENLAKARAIENGVFLVTSGYNHPTYIMDPGGERLSQAREIGSAATATIDLAKPYNWPWLGEMRTRRLKELRVDVAVPTPGLLR